jgi:hypothetical protein
MSRYRPKPPLGGLPGGFLDREALRELKNGNTQRYFDLINLKYRRQKQDIKRIVDVCVKNFKASKKR